MFLKYSCQKPVKTNCGRPVFLEELQAARNFLKVSLHFNKIPNSLRQFLQTYMHFLCATKKSPPKAVSKDWSESAGKSCDEIDDYVMKFIL